MVNNYLKMLNSIFGMFGYRCLLLSVFLVLMLLGGSIQAKDYYQRQSGNWNSSTTWTTSSGNSSTENTGTYPKSGDNVYFYNNGNQATITLTEDVECANLYFSGSEPACVIAQGDYNITVSGVWTTNWSSNTTITQGSGYLQVNGGISQFHAAKTITNFRVGSASFYFTQSNQTTLNVSSNYDFYCYQSVVPTGINASSAQKLNATPCSPHFEAVSAITFDDVCIDSQSDAKSFLLKGLALNSSNITIGPLSGYQFSESEIGPFSSSLTISQSGGQYNKIVYVRFQPSSSISYNGNIPVAGGGAYLDVPVTASGAVSVKPSVTLVSAVPVSRTSAVLSANLKVAGCGGAKVTERGFYYSTTSGFANGTGVKVSETGSFSAGNFSLTATGLSANTVYYYKTYAVNAEGTTYSDQGTFTITSRTYYSRGTGNWTDPNTWTTAGCGQSINAGTYPGAVDNVVLCQGYVVTVNTSNLSCSNLDMTVYNSSLLLLYNFTINGNATIESQSRITLTSQTLTIKGDLSNTGNPYNSGINYTSGNVVVEGKVQLTYGAGGLKPLNCTGTGWFVFKGTEMIMTNAVSVPRYKQPAGVYTVTGSGTLTVENVFDQNFGAEPPAKVIVSIPANTINKPTQLYRTTKSGNWEDVTVWEFSSDAGTTWTPAVSIPTSTSAVVSIMAGHSVALNSDVAFETLSVNSTASLSVNPLVTLTVNSTFVNNGSVTLISDNTGTAAFLMPASASGSGSCNYQQYFKGGRNYYVAIPFGQITLPTATNPEYFLYTESVQSNDPSAYWSAITTSPVAGRGFIVKAKGTGNSLTFSSVSFNNGNVLAPLTNTGALKTGFNLVGNPYPAYIDASKLSFSNMLSTIWVRTHNGTNYQFQSVNIDGGVGSPADQTTILPPMQAFWVKTTGSAGLQFTRTSRTTGSSLLMKAPTAIKQVLRLQVNNAGFSDETVVYFNTNALKGFDSYDSPKMSNASASIPELYTVADGQQLVINGMPQINYNEEIPLGFRTGVAGMSFSIKAIGVPSADPELRVILKDGNSETDITDGNAYTFASGAEDVINRFSIILRSPNATTGTDNASQIKTSYAISNSNGDIQVVAAQATDNARVSVFDAAGQLVAKATVKGGYALVKGVRGGGLYWVKVSDNNKSTVFKVVVR